MTALFRKKMPAKFSDVSIKAHPIFSGMSPAHFVDIEPFFQEKSYESGAQFTVSQTGKTFFAIIRKGAIHIKEMLNKSRGNSTFTISRGESFGEFNLVDPGFSTLECRANEPAELLLLTHEDFKDMTGKNSRSANKLYLNLSNIVSDRLIRINKEYINLYYKHIIEIKGNI